MGIGRFAYLIGIFFRLMYFTVFIQNKDLGMNHLLKNNEEFAQVYSCDYFKDLVLDFYQPDFHFIDKIEVDFPVSKGTFKIPPRQYTTADSVALSGANSLTLMAQVLLVSLLYNVTYKRIPEIEFLSLDTMEDMVDFCRHVNVCSYDKIKFRKTLWKNINPKEFEMKLSKVRSTAGGKLIYFKISYSINSGMYTGQWTASYSTEKFNSMV